MAETKLQGGCLCGAVRYEVSGDPVMTGHCHCEHCRKSAAAGHNTIAAYPESALKVTGKLKTFCIQADSGKMTARSFCPECGSLISATPESMPGMVAITVATLDNPEALTPQMRFYDKRRLSWDTVDPALPAFATVPARG